MFIQLEIFSNVLGSSAIPRLVINSPGWLLKGISWEAGLWSHASCRDLSLRYLVLSEGKTFRFLSIAGGCSGDIPFSVEQWLQSYVISFAKGYSSSQVEIQSDGWSGADFGFHLGYTMIAS